MAEVVGTLASAVAIAGLFKTCLDAFELISVAKHTDIDLKKLVIRLNIERCRLYTWGEALGLAGSDGGAQAALDKLQFGPLVKDTLEMISELFGDSARIGERYGCVEDMDKSSSGARRQYNPLKRKNEDWDPTEDLAESFSNFHTSIIPNPPIRSRVKTPKTTLVKKTRWLIQDKKKFESLITELRSFIDGLQDITKSLCSVARQGGMVRFGIQQISNINTLELLSSACIEDHPEISEAASVKMDVMTIATYKRRGIEDWMDGQDQDGALHFPSNL